MSLAFQRAVHLGAHPALSLILRVPKPLDISRPVAYLLAFALLRCSPSKPHADRAGTRRVETGGVRKTRSNEDTKAVGVSD